MSEFEEVDVDGITRVVTSVLPFLTFRILKLLVTDDTGSSSVNRIRDEESRHRNYKSTITPDTESLFHKTKHYNDDITVHDDNDFNMKMSNVNNCKRYTIRNMIL